MLSSDCCLACAAMTRTARIALLTALAAFVMHAAVIAVKTYTHPARTVLAVFRVGELNWNHTKDRPEFVLRQGFPLEKDAYGTDGQQYLFAAHDLFIRRGDMAHYIDSPRYRYGRMLLPALSLAACGGSGDCLPYAFIGWNLVFATAIGALAALLVAARGGHPAWGLMLACTGALVCSTDIAGTELGAQCFGLLGIYLVARTKPGEWSFAAIGAFALSVLCRETYVLLPAAFALVALSEKRLRDVIAFGASALPAAAWGLYVRRMLPPDPPGNGPFSPPLFGVGRHVLEWIARPKVNGHIVITVLVGGALLAMIAIQFRSLRHDRTPIAIAAALFGVLALVSSYPVWITPGAFGRGLDFLYPGVVLCALDRKDRVALWLSVATVAHALNIVADHIAMAGS